MPNQKPIKIKQILDHGIADFDETPETSKELLAQASRILNSSEVSGLTLFLGKDKKFYVGSVEFVIQPANLHWVAEKLYDDFAHCPHCGHLQEVIMADSGPTVDTGPGCLCGKCGKVCNRLTHLQAKHLAKYGKVPKC
jgi:hypothetical protein